MRADPMAYQIPDDAVSEALRIISDSSRNLMEMVAGLRVFDTFEKSLPRHINQLLGFLADFSYAVGSGRIRMIALINQPRIQADNISLFQNSLLRRDPMHHFIIDRYADRSRISIIVQEIRNTAQGPDHPFTLMVDFPGGNTGTDNLRELVMNLLQKLSRMSHQFNFSGSFNCYGHFLCS